MNKFWNILSFCALILIVSCSSNDDSSENIADDNSEDNDPIDMPDDNVPLTGILPCENGMAGEFPCDGYDLLGRVTLNGAFRGCCK